MIKKYALGKVLSLGSSSEGNSYYIEINRKGYPNPFKLLIECGFSYKRMVSKLVNNNLDIKDIDAVLVTHEHHDHCLSVPDLVKRGKKVYAPQSVFEHFNIDVENKYIMKANRTKKIADCIDIVGFELEHKNDDGSKTYNLGYIINIDGDYGIHKILFVTDTQYIRFNLSNYKFNTIFIEANNLRRNILFALTQAKSNGDTFKAMHFERVLHSHMLVENTINTLIGTKKYSGFDLSETDCIYLIHLTGSGNANPQEIKEKVKLALKENRKFREIKRNDKTYISPKVFVFKKDGELI